jgi:Mg-chelatase subunit ChlD
MAGWAQLRERSGLVLSEGEAAFGRGLAAGKPAIRPAEVTEWAMDRGTVAGVGLVNGPVESAPVLGDMPVVGEAFGLEAKTASLEPSAFGDFENEGAMDPFVSAGQAVFDTEVSAPSGGAAVVAPAGEVALGRETTTFFAGAAMVPEQPELEVQSALRQQTRPAPGVVTRGLALAPRANVEVLDAALAASETTDLKASLSERAKEGAEVESVDKLGRLDALVEQAGVVVVPERPEVRVRELSETRSAGRRLARDTSLGVPLSMERYSAQAPTAAPRPASVAPGPAPVVAPAEVQDFAKRKDAAGDAGDGISLGFAPMKGQGVELEGRLMEEREVLWEESNKKVPALSVVERLGELEVGQKEEKQVALEDHYYAMVTNAASPASVTAYAYGFGGGVSDLSSASVPVQGLVGEAAVVEDLARGPASVPALVPQPEVQVADNPFSTFSLNVTDVSFKLAQASLEQGRLPDPGSIRSEEFINAFRYHDPAPVSGRRVGVTWERARYPFAHNRDLLRFGVQTAAQGREAGRPLNLVLCIDSSGSMKRSDRVAILRSAMEVLAGQLRPEDRFSVVAFARTARLITSGLDGTRAEELVRVLAQLNPEGGTNLEDALRLAYDSARANYVSGGVNRVVLLTDGAANLGNVDGELMRQSVIRERKNGIALDSFGVGWEGYNDDLLETLSRNGDGRYGFLNSPEQVAVDFSDQLAGALRVAASDVKVQMEFNARRVKSYRQIGYAKHQLTKEQFRDNTVDAAELGAAEAGQALYVVETDPAGVGPVGTLRVRFKVSGTDEVQEEEWMIPYEGQAVELAAASSAMRLAATASACSEWLAESPYAAGVTARQLLDLLRGVPESFELEPRPRQLEWMIRQAGSIFGQ